MLEVGEGCGVVAEIELLKRVYHALDELDAGEETERVHRPVRTLAPCSWFGR